MGRIASASKKMGRPAEYVTDKLRPRTVSIDDETARVLTEYGNGVLSAGIRRAARQIAKKRGAK